MKIACIIHSLNGGGAERVMAGLSTRLQAKGHTVTLITLDDGKNDKHDVGQEVHRVKLNLMQESHSKISAIGNTFGRIRKLRRAIQMDGPDAVLSFCDATNVLTLLSTYGLAYPVIVCERSDPENQKLAWPWGMLRPRLYRHAERVVVLTEKAAKLVGPWSTKKPIVIPSAVDSFPPIPTKHKVERTQSILLGVGRLEHEKGFDRLISAFASIAPQFQNWDLKIVGEGLLRTQLEQQVSSLKLTDRVSFPGWIRPIWPAYHAADLFALPSRYEGFPSALLEAMAIGLPVVAVDCESGPREIIRNERDGLLVPNDVQSLSDSLARCMSDSSLRNRLGREAVNVTSRFGWDAMVDAYEKVLIDEG